MLADFIASVLGKILKGNFQQATQALENAYYDFLKQDAGFFQGIPKEKLTETLLKEHNYTNGHLEILAELFYAEAELAFAESKKARSLEFYEKSLLLFEFIERESKLFSFDKQTKLTKIKERIADLNKVSS